TLTLTSMMSTTGEPRYGESSPEAIQALLTPTPSERAAYVDASERALIWRSRRGVLIPGRPLASPLLCC
ncbi:MAG: alpha/beta hydrolase, partial [Candidatus Limnocylindrales bacterium]